MSFSWRLEVLKNLLRTCCHDFIPFFKGYMDFFLFYFFLFWTETWHVRFSLLEPEVFIRANGSKINNKSRHILNTVHLAFCNNCLNTWTFRAQLVSSIKACTPHQPGNERQTEKQPKAGITPSVVSLSTGAQWEACCGVLLKPLHIGAPTAVGVVPTAPEWARKLENKASRRVANLRQSGVDETSWWNISWTITPSAGSSAPSRPSWNLNHVWRKH